MFLLVKVIDMVRVVFLLVTKLKENKYSMARTFLFCFLSAAFNPLINVREIPQNSECLKKEISPSCCLVLQCLFLFPSIFLSLSERGEKLLSEFSFKERDAI